MNLSIHEYFLAIRIFSKMSEPMDTTEPPKPIENYIFFPYYSNNKLAYRVFPYQFLMFTQLDTSTTTTWSRSRPICSVIKTHSHSS